MESQVREKLTYHTDRSRIIDYRRCHRKRYLGYELELVEGATPTRGIAPTAVNLAMTIGSAVHEALEMIHALHSTGRAVLSNSPNMPIDYAVKIALDYFNGKVVLEEAALLDTQQDIAQDEFAFLDAPPGTEDTGRRREFKIKEARALVEMLVRTYYKVGLPLLLDRYEILLVEKEMASLLVDNEELAVQLNGRADAIMKEKATGNLACLSIKTAAKIDYRAAKNWQEDDQGISECYLVKEMVRAGLLEEFGYSPFDNVQVGVQMLQLLKGYEKQDNDGIWKHVNPVVWPYTQEQPSGEYLLRPEYYFLKDDGSKGALGKYWKARHIWEADMPTQQEWIDEIELNFPGVLEKQVLFPQLLLRSDEEMDDWAREAALQEMNLATIRLDTSREENVNWEMLLPGEFPKNRASCNYPGPCEMKVLCHPVAGELGMSDVGEMLVRDGLVQIVGFRQRKANHAAEEVTHVTE